MFSHERLILVWLLLILGLGGGCAARRSGDVVTKVTFDVEGRPFPKSLWVPQSNRALRKVMVTQKSSWQSLILPGAIEPEWFNRRTMAKDEKRLAVWFAEHGYFDAVVTGWDLKPRGKGRRRIQPVSIRVHIRQGEASHVRKLEITGLDEVRRPVARRARAALSLAKEDVYSTEDQLASVAAVRTVLLNAGYAFATVDGSAEAWPDDKAVDVLIAVNAGPRAKFGPITITQVDGIPDAIVNDTVTFKEGDVFSPKDLNDTRTAFFGLRVYSVVNVTPSLADPESATVPVAIEVKPSRWRRLKVGPGLSIETGKGSLYAAAEWEHNNLFHRLWHFDQQVKAGAAAVVLPDANPDALDLSQVTIAPIADLSTALGVPHVIGKNWSFDVDGRLQVGIEPAYRFFSPEIAPALLWSPTPKLTVSAGYRVRYFDYFDFTIDIQDIIDSPLGLDLTDPYLLSLLEQRVIWDTRDDPMAPTKGGYSSFAIAEAGGPFLGNFNFIRAKGELRRYLSMPKLGSWKPRLVVAARVGAGIIAPYGAGPKATVPYAERLYLGGGTTVRGWSANRLGPSTTTTDRSTGATAQVPAGGLFDAMGNIELRKGVLKSLTVAAFTDVGRVWPTLADASFGGAQWSVGGGLRYATAIGPVRGDIGVRLGDDPAFQTQPRLAVHLGLSEAF